MKKLTGKACKKRYPQVVPLLLDSLSKNEAEMKAVHRALFDTPLIGTPGQVHVHVREGFMPLLAHDVKIFFVQYKVEFVVTSSFLHHVGATVKKVTIYDSEREYERARDKAINPQPTLWQRIQNLYADIAGKRRPHSKNTVVMHLPSGVIRSRN